MTPLSHRSRYILLLATSALIIMGFFSALVFSELQRLHTQLSQEAEKQISQRRNQDLVERSGRLIEHLSVPVAQALARGDRDDLQEYHELFSALPLVQRVLLYDVRQGLVAENLNGTGVQQNLVAALPFQIPLQKNGEHIADNLLLVHRLMQHDGQAVGGIVLEISLKPVQAAVARTEKAIASTLTDTQDHFLYSLLVLLLIFGALILLLSALFSYSMNRPIKALMAYSERLALGRWELPPLLQRDDEFGRLGNAFRQMAMQIQANVRSTENLAFYDQMTGIGNRTFFQQQLTDLIEDSEPQPFSVLMIGLDNFKWFNETRGYHAGDELLRQVVSSLLIAMNTWCQNWQISRDRIGLFRIGGDEFGVVIQRGLVAPALTDLAQILADIFDRQAGAPRRMKGMQASIGVMSHNGGEITLAEVQTRISIALNKAKKEGKNCVVYFEPAMKASLQRRYRIEQALLTARSEKQLYMVYQPQICLQTQQVVGFEALMRWQHPEMGFISPGEFFPIAEQMHVIGDLGGFVFEQVLQDIPSLTARYGSTLKVSLNVSAAQFFYQDVAGMIIQGMHQHGISPDQLGVELTETSLLKKDPVVVEQLQRMRDAGVNVLLDDFGTGYASLAYLKEFPITGLKLDRSYTARLCSGDHADFALFESLLYLAGNLGLSTVVEGIENEAEEQQALRAGASCVQGFKYAGGQPLDQVLAPGDIIAGHS